MLKRVVMLSIATAIAFGGCTRQNTVRANDTLVIAQIQEPRSLNPLFLDGYVTGEINGLTYSYLTMYDVHGGMVPQLAAQVPTLRNGGISPDGLRITYDLRRGVKWQDGAPFTARDVVFTFHAIMNPDNNTLSRYGYDDVASITALDPYRVQIRLKKRVASMISYFFGGDSNYGVLPAHLLARYKSLNSVPFNSAPVGTGPYRVVEWRRGDHITFEANDGYFLGTPAIKRIVIKFVPDAQTITNQLHTGEVDAAFFADVSHLAELRALPRHHLVESATTQFGTLQLNTEDAILRDRRVRLALAMSIDRHALTRDVFQGVFDPNTAMQGLFTWAYDPNAGNIPYDPAGARRILDSDGWRMGSDELRHKGGKTLSLSFLAVTGSAASARLVTLISSFASKAGIQLSIKTLTPFYITSPTGPLYTGKYQVAQFTEMSQADPDAAWILGCSQRAPHGFNFTRYCDPVTERLFADGSTTYDRARRMRDYAAVQRRLLHEVPMIFLYQVKEVDAVPDRLAGYAQSMYTAPYTYAYRWHLTQ